VLLRFQSASLAAAIIASAAARPAAAQTRGPREPSPPPGITGAAIDANLRFLSSDLLEGRAPGTRGGELAEQYIASTLEQYGVQPGVAGRWFQPVPIDVVTADQRRIRVVASGKASATLRTPHEVVVWAGSATPASAARGELVFVGYGVKAPEYRWDDFKGADLRGKILLVLVNDPPAPASEPNLFGGKAMTYYGRWTYKFEEAERQGAAGMLIIHTTATAGYPWHTVVGSWTTPQRMLARPAGAPPPLGVEGWITNDAAARLLARAGLDLSQLRAQADSRSFHPVPTGITLDMSFPNAVQHIQANNVVGVVPGSDPALRREYVLYSAHWDHLGIGPAVNGDSIYNGASDNASGVADILAVAHAAALAPVKPKRSQLFVFVTAEEAGLLGSEWFAEHPVAPDRDIVAALNVDGGNLLGRVRDLTVLGASRSSLGPSLAALIRPWGMRLTPPAHPEAGEFYRSDHFSFARAGIPAVSIGAGNDFVGRPLGWGKAQGDAFTAHRYHQPSDQYNPAWNRAGAVQLAAIVYRFGTSLANATTLPVWNPGTEFLAARERLLRGH